MLSNKNIQHPTTLSLDAYYREYYLPDKNKRIRPTTQKHHCYLYRNRVRPYFGDKLFYDRVIPTHPRPPVKIIDCLHFRSEINFDS
jgi:hypothetical protein